jgi:diguanylate cyclase (GGDEF)-like protein/PAS domain S-box-containing protein
MLPFSTSVSRAFLRRLLLWLCLASLALPLIPAYAAEPVRIGVLAFRPKLQTLAQWQPLASALKAAIPERDFVVEALTFSELDLAVASRQLDFVLTNPGHYVMSSRRHGLTAPLATLAVDESGQRAIVFGGVIFSRATQANINTLTDIKGKTIAATSTESLGGYQLEAYELKHAGLTLPQDGKLLVTGMPHDNVVDAVLTGRAEVGFVRTGVLEGMVREGKLDIKQLKIINRQNLRDFPVEVSTRLLPEWPLGALPHIDENLARQVTAALFLLKEDSAATRAMGIRGFTVPADYTPVEDLLRELRLPPFEVAPPFTLQDVWLRYRGQIFCGFLALGLILLLGIRLLLTKRKLEAQHRLVLQQEQQLRESEARLLGTLNAIPDLLFEVDLEGTYHDFHSPRTDLLVAPPAALLGKRIPDVMQADAAAIVMTALQEANTNGYSNGKQIALALAQGETWFELSVARKATVHNEAHRFIVLSRDITERKQMEEQVRQLAFYDLLTKLPNRRLLNDRLSQAMSVSKRSGCYGAVMFFDLDNFKPLNDNYGHAVGDLLLIEVAERLKCSVREMDTVARFGGDEFVVIISELDVDKAESTRQAGIIAEKIRAALAEPYLLETQQQGQQASIVEHHCTTSIGVVMFVNEQENQSDILKWADVAMYQAKEAGRNQVRFYGAPQS